MSHSSVASHHWDARIHGTPSKSMLGYGLYKQYMFDYTMFHPPVTQPTPTVSAGKTTLWTVTSPDGSQVERYIVEFECRVRNITFVEKYMSVIASGGTGGLGQLYRVKVWAVSGPNISPALVCIPDGQCREEGEAMLCTLITMVSIVLNMKYITKYRTTAVHAMHAHTYVH